jgi:bifunctional non-homologous end joining protein LigD
VAETLRDRTILPMKGKADAIPRSEQWVYELKWDGMRVLAFILQGSDGEANRVRLQSSNGRDVTTSFPELQGLAPLADLFDGLVFDGEVVAFDGAKPSFNTPTSKTVSIPDSPTVL